MLATTLQQARRDRGLSLSALAHRAGIHKSTLSRWEGGKTRPYVHELERVMDVLEVGPEARERWWRMLDAPRAARRSTETAAEAPVASVSGGEMLRALRHRAGRTQAETARAVDVAPSLLSQWENNDCWPDPERLDRLCDTLAATAGERRDLAAHAWRHQEPLPRDRDALTALLGRLDFEDTVFDRDLAYLAIAARLDEMRRAGRIGDDDALLVWGFYANHLAWHERVDEAERIAMPVLARLGRASRHLDRGQLQAVDARCAALLRRGQTTAAMETIGAVEDRIAPRDRTWWLDVAAQVAEASGAPERMDRCYAESVRLASDPLDRHLRGQRHARALCRQGRFRDALAQIGDDAPADPRVSVATERVLVRAWVLAGLGEREEALPLVARAASVLARHPFPDQVRLCAALERRLAA